MCRPKKKECAHNKKDNKQQTHTKKNSLGVLSACYIFDIILLIYINIFIICIYLIYYHTVHSIFFFSL